MNNNKGFTLIELLSIIIMLSIITAIAIPTYQYYVTKTRKAAYETLITTSRTAAQNRYIDEGLPNGCQKYNVEDDLYKVGYMDKPADPASTSSNCKGFVYVKGTDSSDSIENYKILVSLACSVYNQDDCKDSGGVACSFSDEEKNECGYENVFVGDDPSIQDEPSTPNSSNSVIDCSNNTTYTTIPSNLLGLAKIMAKDAYLDNGKSEHVESCSGINFNEISSDTNGKGIYEIESTKDNPYPIYYYRGVVNNNVKFAGFCWKAIRTTDTGVVKLIYNGDPDDEGYCTNQRGNATVIETGSFNPSASSAADVGYMYGTRYAITYKYDSFLSTPFVYGGDVTYSDGTYTLKNTMTSTGLWSDDYNTLNNTHYTCFSTGTTCSSVYYIYSTSKERGYYITLTNGKKVSDALDEMFNGSNVNIISSNMKTKLDNWYGTNLSSYSSYIEDTVYCNDRSISSLGGWNPNGGSTANPLYFGPSNRVYSSYSPSLVCNRVLDRFTVSDEIGNGALTYPIGLITSDEVMYAGGIGYKRNDTYYLFNNDNYIILSPESFYMIISSKAPNAYLFYVGGDGALRESLTWGQSNGIRPVISLKSTSIVLSGDGTATNPYLIKTS